MCLAVPVQIVELHEDQAVVELDGVQRSANIALLPDLKVGDYVLLHAGFAIQKWSQADVQEYLALREEMDQAFEALPPTSNSGPSA